MKFKVYDVKENKVVNEVEIKTIEELVLFKDSVGNPIIIGMDCNLYDLGSYGETDEERLSRKTMEEITIYNGHLE